VLPSIWLWAYVAAALVTRLLLSSTPLFRFLANFLDVDGHPIRSLGVVAGAFGGASSAAALIILAII
jgi:hypothetical protein